jgi:hypothetical protein
LSNSFCVTLPKKQNESQSSLSDKFNQEKPPNPTTCENVAAWFSSC